MSPQPHPPPVPPTPVPVPGPGPTPTRPSASHLTAPGHGQGDAASPPPHDPGPDSRQAVAGIVLRLLVASLVAGLLSHLAAQAGPPGTVGRILRWVVLAAGGTAGIALAVLVFLTPTSANVAVANILLWLGLPLLRDQAMMLARIGEAAPILKDWLTAFVEPGPNGHHPSGLAILQGAFLVYSVACLVCFNPPFPDKRMEEPSRFPR